MTIVFWIIIITGTISATSNTMKLNELCNKEVAEGVSKDVKECKQYYFDTRIKKGWQMYNIPEEEDLGIEGVTMDPHYYLRERDHGFISGWDTLVQENTKVKDEDQS